MSVYAVSDLHGRYDIYLKICELLNPEDKVCFLGDAADRGLDGWKLIKAIYNNPQWIYVKGNHEQMLEDAMRNDCELPLLQWNGGAITYAEWQEEGADESWIKKLEELPLNVEHFSETGHMILLNHSGCESEDPEEVLWDRHNFLEEPVGYDIIVHGHTPVQEMEGYIGKKLENLGPMWYCNGHKIDIDIASAYTGKAVLFNLDTFESRVVGG
jgi:serine/threonine protein phosphatase 1